MDISKLPFSSFRDDGAGTVYVSGQVGHIDGKLTKPTPCNWYDVNNANQEDIRRSLPQLKQGFENLRSVLKQAGLEPCHVMDVIVFLTHKIYYAPMNEIYAQFFVEEPRPARTTVFVDSLPLGALFEIKVVARKPEPKRF